MRSIDHATELNVGPCYAVGFGVAMSGLRDTRLADVPRSVSLSLAAYVRIDSTIPLLF